MSHIVDKGRPRSGAYRLRPRYAVRTDGAALEFTSLRDAARHAADALKRGARVEAWPLKKDARA